MDGSQVSGALKWMTMAKAISQVISWVVTLIVIRMLSPSDYGLFAMASIMVLLAEMLKELGLGAALIQTEKLGQLLVRQIFTILIVLNVGVYFIIAESAPLLARFFQEDSLELLIPVLALQFFITAFEIVPSALLARKMDFRAKAIVMIAGAVTSSAITLSCAISGFGVWSLIYGAIAAALGRLCCYGFFEKIYFAPTLDLQGAWSPVSFGGYVTFARFLNTFLIQSSYLIIGRLLGKEALGIFTVANELATLPMQKFSGILNSVGLAAFSRIQSDKQEVVTSYLKAMVILAFCVFPVFWGLASVSSDLTTVVLGEKWGAVAIPLQLIALVAPFQMLYHATTPALLGIGRANVFFSNSAILSLIIPVFVLVGTRWGVNGAAAAWAVAYLPLFTIVQTRSLRSIGVTRAKFIDRVRKSATISFLMLLAVTLLDIHTIPESVAPAVSLAVLVTLGVLTYSTATLLFNKKTAVEFRQFVLRS